MASSLSDPPRADDEQTRGRLVAHLTNAPADRKAEVLACIQGRLATLGRTAPGAMMWRQPDGHMFNIPAATHWRPVSEVAP